MRIAAFYSDSPYASWGQSHGFGAVLRRMGHDVREIPIPQSYKQMRQIKRAVVERVNKKISDCDLIIVSGPEHLQTWIENFYKDWGKLKIPRVGWYHESFQAREDYKIDFETYQSLYDFHFFPDADDAAKFGGEFLSLGVDMGMFSVESNHRTCVWISDKETGKKRWLCDCPPGRYNPTRDIDAAFIGLMYPKRVRFFQELQPHLSGIDFRISNGQILVNDLDGINIERSMELLASQYRRIKVFFAFPSLSNVLVAKPLESGACGALVMVAHPHGLKNAIVYDEAKPKQAAELLRRWLSDAAGREHRAMLLREEIEQNHRMELRFEQIFKITGAKECASASPEPAASSAIRSAVASLS